MSSSKNKSTSVSITKTNEVKTNEQYAKFWYKGSHSHPVRRTVLIKTMNDQFIEGYELREGNKVKSPNKASLKKYCRTKIAQHKNLRLDNPLRNQNPNKSTLKMCSPANITNSGV